MSLASPYQLGHLQIIPIRLFESALGGIDLSLYGHAAVQGARAGPYVKQGRAKQQSNGRRQPFTALSTFRRGS